MNVLKTLLAVMLAVVLLAACLIPAAAEEEKLTFGGLTMSKSAYDIAVYTNVVREEAGVEPLTVLPALQAIAEVRAQEILTCQSHYRPNGTKYTSLYPAGLYRLYEAENIAGTEGWYMTPEQIVQGWVNSPSHYENLVRPDAPHIGVGTVIGYQCTYAQNYLAAACRCSGFELLGAPAEGLVGDKVEDLRMMVKTQCNIHGECYRPVTSAMVTGYDPHLEGAVQTPTVRAYGSRAQFSITLREYVPDVCAVYLNNEYCKVYPYISAGGLLEKHGPDYAVLRADGSPAADSEKLGSGMVLHWPDDRNMTMILSGDVDGDGKITASDARACLRISVHLDSPAPWQVWAADVEPASDKKWISASDARAILHAAIGLEDPADWFRIYHGHLI